MKLLFDHNLSYRLARVLLDAYPGSVLVRELSLERAPDEAIWNYARTHGLAIVSKDSDFHQRSVVEGFPPKVIWIRGVWRRSVGCISRTGVISGSRP